MEIQPLIKMANQARQYFHNRGLTNQQIETAVAITLAREIQPHLQVSVDADVVQSGYIDLTIRPTVAHIANAVNEHCLINVNAMEACALSFFKTRTKVALGHLTGDTFKALLANDDMMESIQQVGLLEPVLDVLKLDKYQMTHRFLAK